MTKKEKEKLIKRLRDLRDRMEAPKPPEADALSHYAFLCGVAINVLDDALIVLST